MKAFIDNYLSIILDYSFLLSFNDITKKSAFEYLDFLGKCINVLFSVEPRKGDGRAVNCNKGFSSIWPSFYMCSAPYAFLHGLNLNTLHDLLISL